ncbi:hypothetical protein LTR17_020972 [Elasticomyces elasticus]|nr:hypothetical protein LTR17_020972 [Elasticomyces elasticus]
MDPNESRALADRLGLASHTSFYAADYKALAHVGTKDKFMKTREELINEVKHIPKDKAEIDALIAECKTFEDASTTTEQNFMDFGKKVKDYLLELFLVVGQDDTRFTEADAQSKTTMETRWVKNAEAVEDKVKPVKRSQTKEINLVMELIAGLRGERDTGI